MTFSDRLQGHLCVGSSSICAARATGDDRTASYITIRPIAANGNFITTASIGEVQAVQLRLARADDEISDLLAIYSTMDAALEAVEVIVAISPHIEVRYDGDEIYAILDDTPRSALASLLGYLASPGAQVTMTC